MERTSCQKVTEEESWRGQACPYNVSLQYPLGAASGHLINASLSCVQGPFFFLYPELEIETHSIRLPVHQVDLVFAQSHLCPSWKKTATVSPTVLQTCQAHVNK